MASYLSEEEYKAKYEAIKAENASKERKRKLKEEKKKSRFKRKTVKPPKVKLFKKVSTSKLLMYGLIFLCLEIVIFCQYAIIVLQDASAMIALIGIPATLVTAMLGYFSKSKKENSAGGIVYETAMAEKNKQNETVQTHVDFPVDTEETKG